MLLYLPLLCAIGQLGHHGWLPLSELERGLLLSPGDPVWWTLALPRFYAGSAVAALWKAAILTAAMLPVVLGYRYRLFWVAFWST